MQIVSKKTFSKVDYAAATVITLGVVIFTQDQRSGTTKASNETLSIGARVEHDPSESAFSVDRWLVGIILLFGYTCSDAFTSTWQGHLYDQHQVTAASSLILYHRALQHCSSRRAKTTAAVHAQCVLDGADFWVSWSVMMLGNSDIIFAVCWVAHAPCLRLLQINQNHMMAGMSCISVLLALFSLIQSGKLLPAISFASQHPLCSFHLAALSVLSACGQVCEHLRVE